MIEIKVFKTIMIEQIGVVKSGKTVTVSEEIAKRLIDNKLAEIHQDEFDIEEIKEEKTETKVKAKNNKKGK